MRITRSELEDAIRRVFCTGAGTCLNCHSSGVDCIGPRGMCFECETSRIVRAILTDREARRISKENAR